MASQADEHAVVARNFPAAWLAANAVATLPTKVQSLLQRIGQLVAAPVVHQGATSLEAVARFQSAQAVAEAVKTLHGTDLRTTAEKRAANFEAPKDSERFWLQPLSALGAAAPKPATVAPAPAVSAVAAAPSATTSGPRKRLKPTGVYLSPLPPAWAEGDVSLLAAPYGTVKTITMETLESGQKGAYIDYQKETAASGALSGLHGLSLMGEKLSCGMQEEPEPERPILSFVIYVDELAMPSRPEVGPRLDDREVFCTRLPASLQSEDGVRAWFASFGDIEEVFLVKDYKLQPSGKAYARFKSHVAASKAIAAIAAAAEGAQAAWSESERALLGTRGSYGLNVLRRLCGDDAAQLQEIRQATGATGLTVGTTEGEQPKQVTGPQLHFVVHCEQQSQADECRALLSAELAKVHVAFTHEVQGSLVLRGFPASWSEKGLKFVFAPFGGLSSVCLQEEPAQADGPATRIAYVKLRNASQTSKACKSLHQTKVGDGDLVEECVVQCNRWHPCAWSDGSFRMGIFVDQLAMSRRPTETGPTSEDKELFVRNLPLQDMNRQQLQEYFEGFGEVEDLYLVRDPFTDEPIGEGYVRFTLHRDAKRCLEALTPDGEAEATDLVGSWSDSERILQRKLNCYRFNLISELVGKDGGGLERLKADGKLKGLWFLADSLQQRDKHAPKLLGKQVHLVGRFTDETHIKLLHELLERILEEVHARIADRIERRKRKGAAAARAAERPKTAAAQAPAYPAPAPGAAWPAPAPYWGGPAGAPPGGAPPYDLYRYPPRPGQAPPPGYPGGPPPPGWGPPPSATVFEGGQDGGRERRRKHRSSEGGEKDGKRRRRHREEGDKAGGAPAA